MLATGITKIKKPEFGMIDANRKRMVTLRSCHGGMLASLQSITWLLLSVFGI
jgi:hypothetical protein